MRCSYLWLRLNTFLYLWIKLGATSRPPLKTNLLLIISDQTTPTDEVPTPLNMRPSRYKAYNGKVGGSLRKPYIRGFQTVVCVPIVVRGRLLGVTP